ncbi:DASH complex subunit Dad3-domain-containing protein [Tricharina praecox]|uniref:DASH complex subunit Dad3-domain-containing protein n=1 Tax=Tricharina praecox TaxID=43433 RepID=UPI0022212677|nr:DASH complex subunit Dad3-domain-containing protein [Tricharina praecox]KAI5847599.1 DASH complex subunit Dad3-domain-containing protein [Tricharina praecox]
MSSPPPALSSNNNLLSPLEQQVLDEYSRLLDNLHRLSSTTAALADTPAAEIMDSLRLLERKTGLVFTLLKASVYSMVLQQQLDTEGQGQGYEGGGAGDEMDMD